MQEKSKVDRWTSRWIVVALAACFTPVLLTAQTVQTVQTVQTAQTADCNSNGIEDVSDIAESSSLDCNDTGVPDECELFTVATFTSDALTPVAGGTPLSMTFDITDQALGDVTVAVAAFADLSAADEYIEVTLNGISIGRLFESGGNDCPETPDEDELAIPRATFNALDVNTNAVLEFAPTSSVDNACPTSSSLTVTVTYRVFLDCNSNAVPDECEADCNTNGVPDECDLVAGTSADCDGNTMPDECQTDCNANGEPDTCDLAKKVSPDCDGNSVPDECDLESGAADCNANGVPDTCDLSTGASRDCDGDNVPDECQSALGDLTVIFRQPPTKTTGIYADADCKHCETPGSQSAAAGFGLDERRVIGIVRLWGGYYPSNGASSGDNFTVIFHALETSLPGPAIASFSDVPATRARTGVTLTPAVDEWQYELTLPKPVTLLPGSYFLEIFNDTTDRADTFFWELGNSVAAGSIAGTPFAKEVPGETWLLDSATSLAFELLAGTLGDCDTNGLLDACELAAGSAHDCNSNGLIDICEPGCSSNGVPDDCMIAAGTGTDCDNNGVPDTCDLAGGGGADCNGNDELDACDIALGTAVDCDRNGVPDDCDLENGAIDCDSNGIPDVCEPDTDGNGTIDACEPILDSDGDGVLDANDRCPFTLPGAVVDESGCFVLVVPNVGCGAGVGAGAGAIGMSLVAGLFFGFVSLSRVRRAGRRGRWGFGGNRR